MPTIDNDVFITQGIDFKKVQVSFAEFKTRFKQVNKYLFRLSFLNVGMKVKLVRKC